MSPEADAASNDLERIREYLRCCRSDNWFSASTITHD